MKKARSIAQNYQALRASSNAKETNHKHEMAQKVTMIDETKASLKVEKERAQKAEKETESVLVQVRELKVKLSTSRMREEENLRTIADM